MRFHANVGQTVQFLVLAIMWAGAGASEPQPRGPAPVNATATEAAAAYYDQGNKVDALPLYDHLAQVDPTSALYAERLAECLMVKYVNLPVGEERDATIARARIAAEHAKSLGDSSDLLKLIVESLENPGSAQNNPKLKAAEAAFSRGDFDAALANYQELAASDPKSYVAPLYAGDVYFRKHDAKQAGEWFAKAILVDPNRETAYRYWGDALAAAGDQAGALQKYVDAVVAEPYSQRPWMGLNNWAKHNRATIKPPDIVLPPAPTVTQDQSGKSVTLINFKAKEGDSSAVWLAYLMNRALWRKEKFEKTFPGAQYRHSLAEEVDSLETALAVMAELKLPEDRVDSSLRQLRQLKSEGMLQAYVLLSAPDQGIAQDYADYRAAHREQLHAYVEKYLVHRD